MRVLLEIGPKHKKLAAFAPDWPGFERGATTEEAAIARLREYLPRYALVASLAGLDAEFARDPSIDVVDRYQGSGSTDFWGISFASSEFDREAVSTGTLARELALMQAAWARIDSVRSSVSADLQLGPRGGGRDRDLIARHVIGNEQDWARKLGIPRIIDASASAAALAAHREGYVSTIRAFHEQGKPARSWPLRYLIRHTAYHTLDHTWEMEDRDLTPSS